MTAILTFKSRPPQTFVFPDKVMAQEAASSVVLSHPEMQYEITESGLTVEEVIVDSVQGDPVYAFVLMRMDVPDYKSGKAQAQSNHAGTAMVIHGYRKPDLVPLLDEWEQAGGGFGTCIVLKVSAAEMRQAVSLAKLMGIHAGIVHDPSYPVYDGEKIVTIPLDTCAYVFGRKSDCDKITGKFPLLREAGE